MVKFWAMDYISSSQIAARGSQMARRASKMALLNLARELFFQICTPPAPGREVSAFEKVGH